MQGTKNKKDNLPTWKVCPFSIDWRKKNQIDYAIAIFSAVLYPDTRSSTISFTVVILVAR